MNTTTDQTKYAAWTTTAPHPVKVGNREVTLTDTPQYFKP